VSSMPASRPERYVKADMLREEILAAVRQSSKPILAAELVSRFNVSPSTVTRHAKRLRQQGLIKQCKVRQPPPHRWALAYCTPSTSITDKPGRKPWVKKGRKQGISYLDAIVDLLRREGPLDRQTIATRIGRGFSTIYPALQALETVGAIEHVKAGPAGGPGRRNVLWRVRGRKASSASVGQPRRVKDIARIRVATPTSKADFYLTRVSGSAVLVGKPSLVIEGNAANWLEVTVTSKDVLPRYLYYVFEYLWSSGQLRQLVRGTAQQHVNVTDIENIPVRQA